MHWRVMELNVLAEASKSGVQKGTVKGHILPEYVKFTV